VHAVTRGHNKSDLATRKAAAFFDAGYVPHLWTGMLRDALLVICVQTNLVLRLCIVFAIVGRTAIYLVYTK
jgi:hypothetical protein